MPPLQEVSFLGTEMALNHLLAALLFILAAATDWLDGYYARKLARNEFREISRPAS